MREKVVSHEKEGREANTSCFSNCTLTACRLAFSRAMVNARSEMSHANTEAIGSSAASVTAMQPEPVPMSRMETPLFPSSEAGAWSAESIHWQSSSVSGLGINTPGLTTNRRPKNSASPTTYCTGSPLSNRATSAAKASPSSWSTPPQATSAKVSPYFISSR